MTKRKNTKKVEESKVETKKAEEPKAVKYISNVRFSGNRRGGDILVGQEVTIKDFGNNQEHFDKLVKLKQIEEGK